MFQVVKHLIYSVALSCKSLLLVYGRVFIHPISDAFHRTGVQRAETAEEADRRLFQRDMLFFCDYVPPQTCRTKIGSRTCLDAGGEKFDACFKFSGGHRFFKSDCRNAAEESSLVVEWQYGIVRAIPRVCVLFFDIADVGDDVDIFCPSGFSRFEFSGRLGTGYPNRTGDGLADCYSCEPAF